MKRIQKNLFLSAMVVVALAGALNLTAVPGIAMPFFPIRSQGTDAAREMVGLQTHINRCDLDKFYQVFALTTQYAQTFESKDICDCLFGGQTTGCATPQSTNETDPSATRSHCDPSCDASFSSDSFSDDLECCQDCCINIFGSCIPGRSNKDWVADYFGLPADYSSTICFAPQIRNFVTDLQAYFGFDEWVSGLYARVNVPVTWTQWRLNYKETILNKGANNPEIGLSLARGYFNGDGVTRKNLLPQATDFFTGQVPNLGEVNGKQIVFEKLDCSRWMPCECGKFDEVKLADFEGVVGWNFLCCERYHLGLNARFTAPTGNTPNGKFLFEPIIGNGGHWELGGGLSGHATAWQCQEGDAAFNIYLDANLTHLLDACQRRCFDLKCGTNSRYWLALRLADNTQELRGENPEGDDTRSDFQFAGLYAPVANLTASRVRVSAKIQADIALKLAYTNGEGFSTDLGYNFWMRTCDKITTCNKTRLDTETWALKGTAYTYGFAAGDLTISSDSEPFCPPSPNPITIKGCDPIALAPSAARQPILECDDSTNLISITNGCPAILGSISTTFTEVLTINGDRVDTSIQPDTLNGTDISIIGTEGLSHKLFAHFDYCWVKHTDWTPFVGMGASVEFGQDKDCAKNVVDSGASNCSPCERDDTQLCLRCSVSQWSIWLKGGAAFN